MELKRQYDPTDLQRYKAEQESELQKAREQLSGLKYDEALTDVLAKEIVARKSIKPPKVISLLLGHTGNSPEQNFSTDLVTEMIQLSLMELNGDTLLFHVFHAGQPVELRYYVQRTPGRYCLHCNEKLEGDENGEMARLHVAMQHAGVPSPDKNVPAGYVWLKHFECVLDTQQHELYKKIPGAVTQYVEVQHG